MAPKKKPESDPHGMFSGMIVFLVPKGVQARRFQIWKERLVRMGAVIEERLCKRVTHVFAMNSDTLLQQLDRDRLSRFKGRVLLYQWLEDCLKSGEKVSEDMYVLNLDAQGKPEMSWNPQPGQSTSSDPQQLHNNKKTKYTEMVNHESNDQGGKNAPFLSTSSHGGGDSLSSGNTRPQHLDAESVSSLSYSPPDQNKNITEIFGKLVNIYRALGDDRRSFSYYKAIAVIEKLPFKIESADQINNLPSIGKSMKDHIQEIITSGKLSKLEHFETDEKFWGHPQLLYHQLMDLLLIANWQPIHAWNVAPPTTVMNSAGLSGGTSVGLLSMGWTLVAMHMPKMKSSGMHFCTRDSKCLFIWTVSNNITNTRSLSVPAQLVCLCHNEHPVVCNLLNANVKAWEGSLFGQRKGQSVFITKLEGYKNSSASEKLAASWPSVMQIVRLISQDHMDNKQSTIVQSTATTNAETTPTVAITTTSSQLQHSHNCLACSNNNYLRSNNTNFLNCYKSFHNSSNNKNFLYFNNRFHSYNNNINYLYFNNRFHNYNNNSNFHTYNNCNLSNNRWLKQELVRTISLFGEVWGIGPSTAMKLYEKGHRSLDDLRNDGSLTNAQKLGLKYFDDIGQRIPRHEVQEMDHILRKAGEDVLHGVAIVCGGSYRRGKATCGDIDIIITHPDGQRQGSDSGVDTYFGFCTYPGRELRHRIDIKVYPRDIYAFGLIAWTGNDVLNRRYSYFSMH
ncbi:hypothetical protein ACSQ67_008668 [Phaseolus vulgaris]